MFNHPLKKLAKTFVAAFMALTFVFAANCWAGDAAFAGIELKIPNETVPPGGMLQLKLEITEPKPILKGGQRNGFKARFLGQVQGVALFSPDGDASGTAVLSKGAAQFSLSSPLASMGDAIDYPIVTIAIPVKSDANPGDTAKLTFEPNSSQWLDPTGQSYEVLTTDGVVTVGGSLSIRNIVPGGGVVPAGTKIAILGIGFQPDSKVQVNEAKIATSSYVSPNEIDITLRGDTNMTARRVRITNPNNERVEYFSYQRTKPMGQSADPLIAATAALYSQTFWPVAYLKPVLTNTQFTGIALQNQASSDARVRLRLSASDGTVLATRNVTLAANRRITRTLAELLGVAADIGTTLRIKVLSGPSIQVLGLLADSTSGAVDPMEPSPAP